MSANKHTNKLKLQNYAYEVSDNGVFIHPKETSNVWFQPFEYDSAENAYYPMPGYGGYPLIEAMDIDWRPYNVNGNPITTTYDLVSYISSAAYSPLMEKTFGPYTISAADAAHGNVYFLNVVPTSDNYYEPWYIHYKLIISTDEAATQGEYDCIIGSAGTSSNWHVFNRFYSTSYYPSYSHMMAFHSSAAKYANRAINPIKLGERIYSARNATTLARTFTIQVLEMYNCEAYFPDDLETQGSFYTDAKYGYNTSWNATSMGLQESSDINYPNYYHYEYYIGYRIHSNSTPLYRYKFVGFDERNHLVPLTITNQESSTIVQKTPCSEPMMVSRGLALYNTTTKIESDQTAVATGTIYRHTSVVSGILPYNFNTTINDAAHASHEIYLVGEYDEETGLFQLDDSLDENSKYTKYYNVVPILTTISDHKNYFVAGKYYWYLGQIPPSNNYLNFTNFHPLFFFDGEKLIQISAKTEYNNPWERSIGIGSAKLKYNQGFAIGEFSVSEGFSNIAYGSYSHAGGFESLAYSYAVAIGKHAIAYDYSFAEGYRPLALSYFSHVEGSDTTSLGSYSHAEGHQSTASGECSHVEGYRSLAQGDFSHAEGTLTKASGDSSHAEGDYTTASGDFSHAEGDYTKALGESAHAEGKNTVALGNSSHAEGKYTFAYGSYSHAENYYTIAYGVSSHAEGFRQPERTEFTLVGQESQYTVDNNSTIKAGMLLKNGSYVATVGLVNGTTISFYGTLGEITVPQQVEIVNAIAYGDYSHSEGYNTIAAYFASHAEGFFTKTWAEYAHAEGSNTTASGDSSHAEGKYTTASGGYSHAEGTHSTASGSNSHAEGERSTASGANSHAEGSRSTASGVNSHAEGELTLAIGDHSHAEGGGMIIASTGFNISSRNYRTMFISIIS